MGARSWHVACAEHHKSAAKHIQTDEEYLDWAVVALFYAANHFVHSVLADIEEVGKDERHPRKHTAPRGVDSGGRGTNQMVRDYCNPIRRQYMDLYEASRRTRYDVNRLGERRAYEKFEEMLRRVEEYCRTMHVARPVLPSDAP